MKKLAPALLLLMVILTACGGDDIVGHWEVVDRCCALSFDFRSNGKFTNDGPGLSMFRGEWKIKGNELCLTYEGDSGDDCLPFSIDGDCLELDYGSYTETYCRDP